MDGSLVFARLHCRPPNTWFLWPTRVQIPNDISIGSAVFAQVTVESLYLQRAAPFPLKLPLPTGHLDPINYDSFGWCTKDSHGQAIACFERGRARRHRHSEVWSRPGWDTARRASMAWRPWSGVLQAGSDSSPVSERPCSTVPVRLLCRGRRCWHSATAAFHQPSTSCTTTLSAQYLWLPGLFSGRPHSLELSPGFYPTPDHQCRLFQTSA